VREETVSGKELSQMSLEELMSELGFSSIQGKRLVKHLAEAVPANFPSLLSMTSPVHTTVKVDEETEQIKATVKVCTMLDKKLDKVTCIS